MKPTESQTTKGHLKSLLALAFIFGCQVSDLHAINRVFNKSDGDWNVAANWSGTPQSVPQSGDEAFIRNTATVRISSNVGTVTRVYLGEANGSGNVVFEAGAVLSVANDFQVIRTGAYANIGGSVTMNGGILTANLLSVGAGSTATSGTNVATANFYGGTYTGGITLGSAANASGVMNVFGSTPIIGNGSSGNFTVNALGQLAFTLDAAGAATVNYTSGTASFASGSLFSVNGSGYTGGAGDIKLVDSATLSWNVAPANVSLTGFTNYNPELVFLDNDVFLRLTAIPEPAPAILALAIVPFFVIRRQRFSA